MSQLSSGTTRARDIPETWNGGASSEMPAGGSGLTSPPRRGGSVPVAGGLQPGVG